MTKTALSAFTRRTGDRIWTSPNQKDFSYSDGDAAEQKLFSIVSSATDLSLFSLELRAAIADWPTEYHLSARRANIIRPLTELGPGVRVLELGCGCGAVTRALAETGASIDAIEGSPRRASIAAERLRDLDNARIHVSNFQDVEFEPQYDIVTLIGVLEYAPVYIDSQNPFVSCLEMAKSALKPGGKLVIAIENQLGLKYLSGISEDHFAIPYYGVEGRYQPNQITTYGKRRLANNLHQAGFKNSTFLYPFPDYKLPEAILTEKAIRHPRFNAADLISSFENRDYQQDIKPNFDLGLAWESVAEEGLLGELSNSFLVIASTDKESSLISPHLLAQKFTDNRNPAFATQVLFNEEEDQITVSRRKLCPSSTKATSMVRFSETTEEYAYGKNALSTIKRQLLCNNIDGAKAVFQKWMTYIRTSTIDKTWLDAIPANIIIDDKNNLHYIDREWIAEFDFDWRLIALRGALTIIANKAVSKIIPGTADPEKLSTIFSWLETPIPELEFEIANKLGSAFGTEVYDKGIRNQDWRALQSKGKESPFLETLDPISQSAHTIKSYHNWLNAHQSSNDFIKAHSRQGTPSARFIVAIDATHSSPDQLSATLKSFAEQLYSEIQPVVVASLPAPPQNPQSILWLESRDFPHILLVELAKANPEAWIGQIKAGDFFSKSGMWLLANSLALRPETALTYGDGDTLDPHYGPTNPQFRPDFDIDHLRSHPYIGRFILIRGQQLLELEGFDNHYGSAATYDLALRFFERYGEETIFHLPEILFHGHPESLGGEDQVLHQEALTAHLRRAGIGAQISAGRYPGSFCIKYQHDSTPLVSIIIPTKDKIELLQRCLESLLEKTSYKNYEVLIVDNQSTEASAVQYIKGLRELNAPNIRILDYPHPFNFSAINNTAAREARGEYLVLLNNDTAIIQPDWLEALLNHAQRSEVGIVGAKLLYPNGTIQHAGVILGLRGPADHPFIGEAMDAPGYFGRLLLDQQYSAVTAACLMIRKSIYQQVGGMDEENFKVSYNDVDLCLKVRELNYSVVWTPRAVVMHEGNVSQNSVMKFSQTEKILRFEAEQDCMYQKWMSHLTADPFYNRNLSLGFSGFELELDPLLCRPAVRDDRPTILALNADTTGSGHYRVIEPVAAMKSAGLIQQESGDNYLSPVLLSRVAPDVIVLQRQYSDEQIVQMARCRQFSRARMIYELDDFLPNLPVASTHKGDFPKDIWRRIRKAAALCNRVVVSTEALKSALGALHSDIVVLPNYLPPAWWGSIVQRAPTRRGGKPRLGWAGGISHAGDLRLIADVVKALADQVDWVFFGMMPEGVDARTVEFHPGVEIEQYPEHLAALDLDLALAPLEINQFNTCKSNLRLLEYGACGYPVIATDIEPYRCGLPATLVKNKFRLWVDAILEKLADRNALQCEGEALQKAIRDNWMLEGDRLTQWQRGWTLDQREI